MNVIETEGRTIISQNMIGSPLKSWDKVFTDLRTLAATDASIICFQGMQWPWYWVGMSRTFPQKDWGRFPGQYLRKGRAQVVIWDKNVWEAIDRQRVQLHGPVQGHAQARNMNAVLLQDRETHLRLWVKNTHYAPDGEDESQRPIWTNANKRDRMFATQLSRSSGKPIINTGDYKRLNYDVLGETINRHTVEYVGAMGVEYTAIVPGEDVHLKVTGHDTMTQQMHTVRSGRVTRFKLQRAQF
jgi:hypothetical protein